MIHHQICHRVLALAFTLSILGSVGCDRATSCDTTEDCRHALGDAGSPDPAPFYCGADKFCIQDCSFGSPTANLDCPSGCTCSLEGMCLSSDGVHCATATRLPPVTDAGSQP